jgi:demethylspheroidene O-methyltransferase
MVQKSWREGWIALRNRLLASPRFHRAALDFPLTRPIALGRVAALFDLTAGFVYSQVLSACVDCGLLGVLRTAPQTGEQISQKLDLPQDSADRLLGAAGALGLVEDLGAGRFALGSQGAALLGNPGLAQMISHHRHLYADLAEATTLLRHPNRAGELAAFWPYATSSAPRAAESRSVKAYSALMAATLPGVAADIFDAYDLRRKRRLMDVGGGSGAFLCLAGERAPGLRLTLFDLPAVTEQARARLMCAGLLDRTEIIPGDFLSEPLPRGADLITLVRILHDHDDHGVATLLRAAREALAPGGALLVAEPMSGSARRERVGDAYFAFYLLAMGRGRARTPEQIQAMMRQAGFRRTQLLRTRAPMLLRAILAEP